MAEKGYRISGIMDPLESIYNYYAFGRRLQEGQTKMSRWSKRVQELQDANADLDKEFDNTVDGLLEETAKIKQRIQETAKVKRAALDDLGMTLSEMRRDATEFRNAMEEQNKQQGQRVTDPMRQQATNERKPGEAA